MPLSPKPTILGPPAFSRSLNSVRSCLSIDAVPDTIIFVFQRPAVRDLAARPGCIHGGPLKSNSFHGYIAFYIQATPNGVSKHRHFQISLKQTAPRGVAPELLVLAQGYGGVAFRADLAQNIVLSLLHFRVFSVFRGSHWVFGRSHWFVPRIHLPLADGLLKMRVKNANGADH